MFYQLFHDKETYELKIQSLTKIFKKDKNLTKRISELGENDVLNYNDYYVFGFVGTESDWSNIETNIIYNLINNEVDDDTEPVLETLFDKTKFDCIYKSKPTAKYDHKSNSFTDIFGNIVKF